MLRDEYKGGVRRELTAVRPLIAAVGAIQPAITELRVFDAQSRPVAKIMVCGTRYRLLLT